MCGCFTFLRIFWSITNVSFTLWWSPICLFLCLLLILLVSYCLIQSQKDLTSVLSNWKTQNTFSSCFCLFNMYGFSDNVPLFILILVICAFSFYLNLAKGLLVLSVICTVLVFPNKQQKSLWYLSSLLCAFLFNWFLHYIISILLCVYSLWFSFYNFLG